MNPQHFFEGVTGESDMLINYGVLTSYLSEAINCIVL